MGAEDHRGRPRRWCLPREISTPATLPASFPAPAATTAVVVANECQMAAQID